MESLPVPLPSPITIYRLPPSSSSDRSLTTHLSTLINTAYSKAYIGIWPSFWRRTNPLQVAAAIEQGSFFCAYLASNSTSASRTINNTEGSNNFHNGNDYIEGMKLPSPHSAIVGTIQLKTFGHSTAEFALLAVSPSAQGFGLGRILIQHLEIETLRRGLGSLRCEALVPMGESGGLVALYERMGFMRIGLGDKESVPHVEHLLVEIDYVIFEKVLGGVGARL